VYEINNICPQHDIKQNESDGICNNWMVEQDIHEMSRGIWRVFMHRWEACDNGMYVVYMKNIHCKQR
jgi:hypothetical protein